MISENVMNCILRFAVGLKLLFEEKQSLKNFILPILFGLLWCVICTLACKKNGDYDAPPSLYYM